MPPFQIFIRTKVLANRRGQIALELLHLLQASVITKSDKIHRRRNIVKTNVMERAKE